MYKITITTKDNIFEEIINDITELYEVLEKYPNYISINAENTNIKKKVRK